MQERFSGPHDSFTLIELLVVVAIIAILSAIAVPNFMESQARAKTARVRADMRALATALESYRLDHGAYPQAEINGTLKYLFQLSTPVAYIADPHLDDPFTSRFWVNITQIPSLRYYGFDDLGVLNTSEDSGELFRSDDAPARIRAWALFSHGPDRVRNNLDGPEVTGTFIRRDNLSDPARFVHFIYDATNGTISKGEILRGGGEPVGFPAAALRLVFWQH